MWVWMQEKADVPAQCSQGRAPAFSAFLVYSCLRLSAWGPHTLRRAICFTLSTDSNVKVIKKKKKKHPHRNIQNHVWTNIWIPHGPGKLTGKPNHHCIGKGWLFSSQTSPYPQLNSLLTLFKMWAFLLYWKHHSSYILWFPHKFSGRYLLKKKCGLPIFILKIAQEW